MKKIVGPKNVKKAIGFRLEDGYCQEIKARAEKLNMSISDLVRDYVVAGLREEAAKNSVYDALGQVRSEIREIRRDLSLMTAVLLIGAGKIDEKEAHRPADSNV